MADPFDESSPPGAHNSDAADGSPASSKYSSCDGSEFDRYCSANSALGSASVCSSVGNYSELLDSVKNLNRWNGDFTISNGFDCLSDGGVESPRENGRAQDLVLMGGMGSLSKIRTGSKLFLSSNENSPSIRGLSADCNKSSASGSGSNPSFAMNRFQHCSTQEATDFGGDEGNSIGEKIGFSKNLGHSLYGSTSDYNIEDGIILEGDGDTSSRCEHSEGEDSILDYSLDNEGCKRNNSQRIKEAREENENPLLMSSSVAFGSDDWDEFMHETGGDGLASLSLYQDQLVQQQPSTDHVDAASLIEQHVDGRDMTIMNPLTDYEAPNIQKALSEENSREDCVNFEYDGRGREIPTECSKEVAGLYEDEASKKQVPDESELTLAPCCDSVIEQSYTASTRAFQGKETGNEVVDGAKSLLPMVKIGQGSTVETVLVGNSISKDVAEEDLVPDEAKKLETFDSYDEMVLEMEEILLDSGNSHGAGSTQANRGYTTQQSHHFRDGSSTASTSGTDDAYPLAQYPCKIDRVEVVGAKQKQGDVSFGERLVGVKEYTIYKLRVWSGKDQWEVERRYRDFFALYRQLNTLFREHGLSLPSPWSSVERESRKIFGNASPNVISERSTLIQDCLRSILNSKYPFGVPSSLICFLSPGKAIHNSGLLKSLIPQSLQKLGQDQNLNFSNGVQSCSEDVFMLGKTISLVVEIKPLKSMRQLLEAQHYTCAGCHRHLDAGKTLLQELVQTFGWNKPRFCEYTGQLFCASCHTNDTAVLPAKVLHHWDFSLHPVSQLAKAYLESIYDQPMLCVSAVNPFLFSKVPALLHVMGIRKKIGAMLPYVRCPFRRSVQRSLGIRSYLLEGNDFFALRDLVDLSKGAFAALPIMVETVSSKILEHITEQCLVCYDSGIPCVARQDCYDPSSLIFPFQEAEAERCGSCGSIFHKPCFIKLMGCCPCGKLMAGRRTATGPTELDGASDRSIRPSGSSLSSGFLSDILSKARPDKMWRPKNSNPVILMGSLPSTSL